MKIIVRRFEYGDNYTLSRMYVGEVYECYVLEDKVRAVKVQNETAISAGTYKVVVDFSPHFNMYLPHILDVPNFDGVRIHAGNTDKDTEGCLLVGTGWAGGDMITNSRVAFSHLFDQILAARQKQEEITIEVIDTK